MIHPWRWKTGLIDFICGSKIREDVPWLQSYAAIWELSKLFFSVFLHPARIYIRWSMIAQKLWENYLPLQTERNFWHMNILEVGSHWAKRRSLGNFSFWLLLCKYDTFKFYMKAANCEEEIEEEALFAGMYASHLDSDLILDPIFTCCIFYTDWITLRCYQLRSIVSTCLENGFKLYQIWLCLYRIIISFECASRLVPIRDKISLISVRSLVQTCTEPGENFGAILPCEKV